MPTKKKSTVDSETASELAKLAREKGELTTGGAAKLLQRFSVSIIVEAIENLPLDHPKVYGFLNLYCKNHSKEADLKTNRKINLPKLKLLSK